MESFKRFDYENYTPRPKSAEQARIDEEIAEYNKLGLVEKAVIFITECFSMQKTPERIAWENQHEKEWRASGVKSWKELFNLD